MRLASTRVIGFSLQSCQLAARDINSSEAKFAPPHKFMLGRLQRLLPFAFSSVKLQNPPSSAHITTMSGAPPEIATFAAGCFWGVEHIFLKHYPISENKGILKTAVGYTGGKEDVTNPSYRQVCTGTTDHAEALRIEFDPSVVKYDELVGASPCMGTVI